MTDTSLVIHRRALLGGLGASVLWASGPGWAQTKNALPLEAIAGTIALKVGQPPTACWQLAGGADLGPLRFKRGETMDVTLTNRLPVPVALNWIGLDGNPSAEPMTGRQAIAPNATATYPVMFRHAGTLLAELWFSGAAQILPATGRAVIISETEAVPVDRDEVLVFQDWRVPGDIASVFTVNGAANADLTIDRHQRRRLRFINSSQTIAIAVKISDYEVSIMGIDGQPSEPFLARDGMIVLTPGSRVDAFIDATKASGSTATILLLDGREARSIGKITTSDANPARAAPLPASTALPANGLPAQLDLKAALRIDLAIGTGDWLAPASLAPTTPPAFKVKRGRTVVIALTNRDAKPAAFHLHGHHFRVLDRMDDGWKPFWRDTLAIDVGQTQRIAFAAEYPGLYPMTTTAAESGAPRRARSYLVE